MANGLMSGLREFGENFVLSAGTQIAKNIQEQSKQDKADILTQTKLLRTTIAKNKAADAKIQKNIFFHILKIYLIADMMIVFQMLLEVLII